ncbi:MAG: hypothetical protein ACRDZY_22435, partial [Acidimicrobiales bacterium]
MSDGRGHVGSRCAARRLRAGGREDLVPETAAVEAAYHRIRQLMVATAGEAATEPAWTRREAVEAAGDEYADSLLARGPIRGSSQLR